MLADQSQGGKRTDELDQTFRILVTGGSGFIGTNLIDHFLARRVLVLNIDMQPPRNPQHESCWIQSDIRQTATLKARFAAFRPTHVIHMAARTDLRGATLRDYTSNTAGVEAVVEAVRSCSSVYRVVFGSSMLVCRAGYIPKADNDYAPSTMYGESKVVGEEIVRSAALANPVWITVRPSSIWGPWFGEPYRDFFLAIIRGRFVKFGAGQVRKTFGYVGNVVHQVQALLSSPAEAVNAKCFYLGDQPPLNVEDWADAIAEHAGVRRLRKVPFGLMRFAARIGDVLSRVGLHSPMTTFRLTNMTTSNEVDLTGIYGIAGTPPYTVEAGIRETLSWLSVANHSNR